MFKPIEESLYLFNNSSILLSLNLNDFFKESIKVLSVFKVLVIGCNSFRE